MSKKPKKPCAACGRGFVTECTKGGKCDPEGYMMYIRSGGALLPPEETKSNKEPVANKKKGKTFEELSDPHSTVLTFIMKLLTDPKLRTLEIFVTVRTMN